MLERKVSNLLLPSTRSLPLFNYKQNGNRTRLTKINTFNPNSSINTKQGRSIPILPPNPNYKAPQVLTKKKKIKIKTKAPSSTPTVEITPLLELLPLLIDSISFYISYSSKLDRYIFYLDNLSRSSTSLIPYKKALIKYKKALK